MLLSIVDVKKLRAVLDMRKRITTGRLLTTVSCEESGSVVGGWTTEHCWITSWSFSSQTCVWGTHDLGGCVLILGELQNIIVMQSMGLVHAVPVSSTM